MAEAAQPKSVPDEAPLSPWWIRSVLMVMVLGFSGLLAVTALAYRNAPPIPGQVVDANGNILFTEDDISSGQTIFLRYGLMDNGTVWGHGAYLGPDYAAEALHRIGEDTYAALAQQQNGKSAADLTSMQAAAIRAQVAVILGTNIGLLMMVALSLFPGGVLQVWDVVQHGYWHGRSLAYTGTATARLIEWLRLPGDLMFIICGALPLTVAAIKGYIGVSATPRSL